MHRPDEPPGPVAEPPTTRIGGSGSARVAVVGVVVVLVALVWVGWSGREPAPAAQPAPPAVASSPRAAARTAVPTPTSTATAAPSAGPVGPSSTPIRAPSLPIVSDAEDLYAAVVRIDHRPVLGVLQEVAPDRLQTALRLPFPDAEDHATIELIQLWTRQDRTSFVPIGSWDLPLKPVANAGPDPRDVLAIEVGGRVNETGGPVLVNRGFSLEVGAQSQELFVVVLVSVELVPTHESSPTPRGRTRIQGDDGILGWPTIESLPEPGRGEADKARSPTR